MTKILTTAMIAVFVSVAALGSVTGSAAAFPDRPQPHPLSSAGLGSGR
jgi:hypothetical protein